MFAIKRWVVIGMAFTFLLGSALYAEGGSAEKTGKKADETVEKSAAETDKAAEEAGEKTGEALQKTGDKIDTGAKKVGSKINSFFKGLNKPTKDKSTEE